jgi:LysM repeat protein
MAFLAIVFAFISPAPAHGGLLSFLGQFFEQQDFDVEYNAQTVPLLSAPNSLEPNTGIGGSVLDMVDGSSLLPVVGPVGSIADVETYKFDQIVTYTVHQGDTVEKIAKMFDITPGTVLWANNLPRGASIKKGDVLVILPVSGIQYEVKKGDTAASLAKKYKSDADEIIAYNSLDADGSLATGSTIIIPDGESAVVVAPRTQSQPRSGSNPYRGGGGVDLGGYYIRPIVGGRRTQGIHGYNGVDLANSCGTPIYASASGSVIIARSSGWNSGYGRYVVISHSNGTQTLYAHMTSVYAKAGSQVSQGTQIGTVGSTGKSTGCHIHFEVRGAKNPF